MSTPLPAPTRVLRAPVRPVTLEQLHDVISDVVEEGKRARILNVSVHCINRAWKKQPWLLRLLDEAELVGYFDKNPGSKENEAAIAAINAAAPGVLPIGFGMPPQETWIEENWERLGVRAVPTGGAVFDYVSGDLRRAPDWMTRRGLEWLGRLLIEPRRLWIRYLMGDSVFVTRLVLDRLSLLRPRDASALDEP